MIRTSDRQQTYPLHRQILLAALLVLISVCPTSWASAQIPPDTVKSLPGIEIETSVDQAEIFVGDQIIYSLAIAYDSTIELIPPPLGANLGAFEVKDYEPDLREVLDDGRIRSETRFTVSTFTTGEYVIPPLPVTFRLPDSSTRVVMAEGVPISVQSLLGDEEADTLDIKPLKAQVSHKLFAEGLEPEVVWPIVIGIFLLVAALVWFFLRRKLRPVIRETRQPWEVAFADLAALQQSDLLERNLVKQYYVHLSEIPRAFLGRIYALDALEMTTTEFDAAFRDQSLPSDWHARLIEFFRHADLVKFARFEPDADAARSDLNLMHDMVDSVRADYEARMSVEAAADGGSSKTVAPKEKAA